MLRRAIHSVLKAILVVCFINQNRTSQLGDQHSTNWATLISLHTEKTTERKLSETLLHPHHHDQLHGYNLGSHKCNQHNVDLFLFTTYTQYAIPVHHLPLWEQSKIWSYLSPSWRVSQRVLRLVTVTYTVCYVYNYACYGIYKLSDHDSSSLMQKTENNIYGLVYVMGSNRWFIWKTNTAEGHQPYVSYVYH